MVSFLYLAQIPLCQFKILSVNKWDITSWYLAFWRGGGFGLFLTLTVLPHSPASQPWKTGGGEVSTTLSSPLSQWHQTKGLILLDPSWKKLSEALPECGLCPRWVPGSETARQS